MGKDKKRQLNQLLAFVRELYDHPDNSEFAEGIREMVMNDTDFAEQLRKDAAQGSPDAIRKIEAYLSLDFRIDSKDLPDYSFVQDDAVRDRLQADYREMLRYEFGTRNHRIDFPEFCRYAVLQIEMLVNFYFDRKYNSNIGTIIGVIKSNFPNFNPYPGLANVSEIQLKTKLYQIRNEFSWDRKDLNPFLYAVDVRNRQSHRSLAVDRDVIASTEEDLRKGGAWVSGRPDYAKAVQAVGQDVWNEYSFQRWLEREPFEEVTAAIRKLADAIAQAV